MQRSDHTAQQNTTSSTNASTSTGRTVEASSAAKINLPVLQLGSADRTVGILQRALAALGYMSLLPESRFGSRTDQAVRSFQEGSGLRQDGIVGNRQTWPAISKALVTRHEGITRLADAMAPGRALAVTQAAEMKQLGVMLGEFSDRVAPTALAKEAAIAAPTTSTVMSTERSLGGETVHTVRAGQTIADVARAVGLPVAALIAANPELTKPYLILQGQLLTVPNSAKERSFRRPPKQLHPADPDGHLAHANMNPDFVALVNGMIAHLRSEGHDVRVIGGYRSFAEQQQRFEQGRRSTGKILTDCAAGHSWHNYGLAVDIVLNDDEGQPAWPEDSAQFWQRLADVALAHGAVWGGRYGYPAHVEYHPALAHGDAGSLIADYESYGLEAVWDKIELELLTEDS